MMRLPSLGAALALVALTGCGHTDTYVVMLRPAEPKVPAAALFLATQSAPPRPLYEIALLQAIGYGNDASSEGVAGALTDKAARLGCNAVVRVTVDVGYARAHAAGVCVKLGEPPASLGPGPSTTP